MNQVRIILKFKERRGGQVGGAYMWRKPEHSISGRVHLFVGVVFPHASLPFLWASPVNTGGSRASAKVFSAQVNFCDPRMH